MNDKIQSEKIRRHNISFSCEHSGTDRRLGSTPYYFFRELVIANAPVNDNMQSIVVEGTSKINPFFLMFVCVCVFGLQSTTYVTCVSS